MGRPYTRIVLTWVILAVVFVVALIAAGILVYKNTRWTDVTTPPAGTLKLSSPAFENNGTMPAAYTADGADVSPPLQWQGAPAGTKSFAIVVEDVDSPSGAFTHWLIAEIPAQATGLPEGIPTQDVLSAPLPAVQGLNSFKKSGYGGPKPPAGKVHRYHFYLYALDGHLDLPGGFNKNQLRAAMHARMLAEATLVGRYERTK
jgi:Raf kinase inhibitor-like YbhB/YbcL family protein